MATAGNVRFEFVDGGRLRFSGDMRLAHHAPAHAQRDARQFTRDGRLAPRPDSEAIAPEPGKCDVAVDRLLVVAQVEAVRSELVICLGAQEILDLQANAQRVLLGPSGDQLLHDETRRLQVLLGQDRGHEEPVPVIAKPALPLPVCGKRVARTQVKPGQVANRVVVLVPIKARDRDRSRLAVLAPIQIIDGIVDPGHHPPALSNRGLRPVRRHFVLAQHAQCTKPKGTGANDRAVIVKDAEVDLGRLQLRAVATEAVGGEQGLDLVRERLVQLFAARAQ